MSFSAVADLKARLPEIAWRLRRVGSLAHHVPVGLFACLSRDPTYGVEACIQEVSQNLQALEQTGGPVAYFLAKQINQKIEVLLRLSQLLVAAQAPAELQAPTLEGFVTRAHRLDQLRAEITRLSDQHAALESALVKKISRGLRDESVTTLQCELGELARYLTKAQEAFALLTGARWCNYRVSE